jgi:hypothetical protein
MVKYQDSDNNWKDVFELLGVQRIEGVHVTGEATFIALLKTLERNHVPTELVDQVCFDKEHKEAGDVEVDWCLLRK